VRSISAALSARCGIGEKCVGCSTFRARAPIASRLMPRRGSSSQVERPGSPVVYRGAAGDRRAAASASEESPVGDGRAFRLKIAHNLCVQTAKVMFFLS
jgi:hypothetical protein